MNGVDFDRKVPGRVNIPHEPVILYPASSTSLISEDFQSGYNWHTVIVNFWCYILMLLHFSIVGWFLLPWLRNYEFASETNLGKPTSR